jgi:hypothetical protein
VQRLVDLPCSGNSFVMYGHVREVVIEMKNTKMPFPILVGIPNIGTGLECFPPSTYEEWGA